MILGSLRFLIVTHAAFSLDVVRWLRCCGVGLIVAHAVFSSVGTEMLAGGSVVPGWDPIERAGPKDDRQVTVHVHCFSKKYTIFSYKYSTEKALVDL